MKTCKKCGEEKPPEGFPKDKRSSSGRGARCKTCVNAEARERYPRYRKQKQKYQAANRERFRDRRAAAARRRRAAEPERFREKARDDARKFRERNPDYYRDRYQKNIEEERARSREIMRRVRKDNPEGERAKKRRYREKNRESVAAREREKTYARRAKQRCSPELAKLMAELVMLPCVYCGATGRTTIDHIVPLSRGGKHEASNLAPACLPCNASKGSKLTSEWRGRGIF